MANYSAAVLTEVLATFLTTAALVCFAKGLGEKVNERNSFALTLQRRFSPLSLVLLGAFLTGIATLVRPEMPLLFVVAVIVFSLRWWRSLGFRKLVLAGAAMAGAFLIPVIPWAARNLMTLHEVQFLAPRYTTMPGEYASVGYYAWTGTWLERYRDVYLNIWKIGEERDGYGRSSRCRPSIRRRKKRKSRTSSNDITTATTWTSRPRWTVNLPKSRGKELSGIRSGHT